LKECSNEDIKSITNLSVNDVMNIKELNPKIALKFEFINNNLNRSNQNNNVRFNKNSKRKFLETNFKEIAIAQFYDEKLIKENIQTYEEKFATVKNHMNLLIKQIECAIFQNIQSKNILDKEVLNSQKLNFDNLKKVIKDMIGISGVLSSLNQVLDFFFTLKF
jgi:hypothetical protein